MLTDNPSLFLSLWPRECFSHSLAEQWWRQTAHCAHQASFSVAPTVPVAFGSRRSPIFCYHLLWRDKTSVCVTAQIPACLLPLAQTCMHTCNMPKTTKGEPACNHTKASGEISPRTVKEKKKRKIPNFLTRVGELCCCASFQVRKKRPTWSWLSPSAQWSSPCFSGCSSSSSSVGERE